MSSLKLTTRPIKAALLDQNIIAGLGNIYVDELLFHCRLHPLHRADQLTPHAARRLVAAMRRLLHRAIARSGSSVRDYVNANGSIGQFQRHHQVYGRAGQACRRCLTILSEIRICGRTSVFCPMCQVNHEIIRICRAGKR